MVTFIALLAPSPWMLSVLCVWWAWRYAALPTAPSADGPLVIAGFFADALLWHAVFTGARAWRAARAGPAAMPKLWLLWTAPVLALSASVRALDALNVHLVGERFSAELVRVIAADPGAQLLALRGLLLAVAVSCAVGAVALHRDGAVGDRLIGRFQANFGARGGILVAGVALVSAVVGVWVAVVFDSPPTLTPEVALLLR